MRKLMLEGDQVKLAGLLSQIWLRDKMFLVLRMETLEPPARTWVVAFVEP